jgi:hypothetical protein
MNIVTAHSSIPFWILIAITTGVMITGSLVKDLTAQALTTHERYHIGWEDGCADVNSHSDTHHNFYSHDGYYLHSSDHMKHYNHGLADCISQHPYNTIDMNHNTYNNNNNDNNPSAITTSNNQGQANATTPTNPATTSNNQGQANNQRVFCVVAVGTCNVTSGQAQNLDNK